MAVPVWFDENVYWNNKLSQLGKEWDADHLKTALETAGYSTDAEGLYQHFQDFGNAENLSPNAFFNVPEYLKAKADHLNGMENGQGFEGHQWNEASVLAAIQAAGLSVWEHYTQYGMDEGVNPSNQFDTSAYLAAKLAQLQADEPDQNWTEASLLEALHAAGLNPVEHYLLYGQGENLSAPAVPDAEKVFTDFDPYTPSNPGEIFTLSTSADVITGTANDDTINGVSSALSSDRTLNPDDTIDGGEGNDTLHVDMQANFSGFTTGALTNVETVALSNGGSVARTFTAKGVDGVDTYTLDARGAVIHLAELASAGITVNLQGQKQDSTIGFTTDAVKGESDALTLGLNGVGSEEKAVKITASGIEEVTVKAMADNHVDLSAAATRSVTVSGPGNLTVTKVAAGVESFDASALTGNVQADLSDADTVITLKGGAGNDTFTVSSLAANAVIDGGAGNDTLVLKNITGVLQPTMSGFENVTVAGTSDLTISGKNVSDFHSLTLQDGARAKLVNVDATDVTITASGAASGGATLGDAVTLTYNTQASVDAVEAKTANSVSGTVTADKATSATVNVGAYTAQSGALSFAAAKDVTVNVASGLGEDGKTEQTSFAATLNAGKADTLAVNAQGLLGASTFNVGAASAVNVNAAKGGNGAVAIVAGRATDVSVTAGGDLNLTGSDFSGAQSVTLTQTKGALSGAGDLDSVHLLTVSGADKTSAVTVGTLGTSTQDYDITVNADGLAAGFTAGAIDAGNGATVLNFADVSGLAKTGTVDGGSVTVQASLLGRTEVGAVTADTGHIVIDARGILGGGSTAAATDDALTVGAMTAARGSVSVSFDGGSDVVLGAMSAKSVELDASGYLGKVGAAAGAGPTATLGAIAADTVTITGSEIGTNDFASVATITAKELNFTGGLDADKVDFTATADATSLLATLHTGAGADVVSITGDAATTGIKISGDLGGDTGDTITVDGSASVAALTIDLSGLTGYMSTLTGGAEDDTFILGAGADSVEVGARASAGLDTVTGFAAGDTFKFVDVAGKAVDKTSVVGGAATLDAALALLGADILTSNSAVVFSYDGDTYLVIDGGTAGYSESEDAVVKLAGLTAQDVVDMGDIFVA